MKKTVANKERKNKYTRQFFRTDANKARKAKKLEKHLAKAKARRKGKSDG
jgi:hypothetical protein